MKRLILAALLLTAMSGAWAGDASGSYLAVGVRTCAAYIEDKQAASWAYLADQAWVGGYITAYNSQTPDTASILGDRDMNGVMAWLENYCRVHPSSNLGDGMTVLMTELYPDRYRTRKDAEHDSGERL